MRKINNVACLLLLASLIGCNDNSKDTNRAETGTQQELKAIFINGDSLHYIDVGEGDPVVFVHGAVGDYRTFGSQMDAFAKNHRVIAYSRRFAYPNHQAVTDSAAFSVVSQANDLAQLLKALKLGPAHLYGHSYGADIVLVTALNNPELVKTLILGEPFIASLLQSVPGGDSILNSFSANVFAPVMESFKNNKNEDGVRTLINGVMGDSTYYDKLSERNREIMMANYFETKGIFLGTDNFPTVVCDDVKKIKVPVLLVKGDKSPAVFPMIIEELNRCLSNRELTTLTNTTHGLEYESPDKFNKAVLEFLGKH